MKESSYCISTGLDTVNENMAEQIEIVEELLGSWPPPPMRPTLTRVEIWSAVLALLVLTVCWWGP